MPFFFDSEEKASLEQELRNLIRSQTGMDAERFDKCMYAVFYCIELYGFNKPKVKSALEEDSWNVPGSVVDLAWNPIRLKAQRLAERSFHMGVITAVVFTLFFLALFSQQLGVEEFVFIKDDAPEWVRSKWVVVVAGIGLLASVVHVFRGWFALCDIQKNV